MDKLVRVEFVTSERILSSGTRQHIGAERIFCAVSTDELRAISTASFWQIVGFLSGAGLSVLLPLVVAWQISSRRSILALLLLSSALGIVLGILFWHSHGLSRFVYAPIPTGKPNLSHLIGVIDSTDPSVDPDRTSYGTALTEKFRKQGLRVP